ncbi:MAG: tetratricopeptide repeat protein [Chloroflexi bacterium]|nr:tetratricopeptide repeat protein [Chloroflexota bacterium]
MLDGFLSLRCPDCGGKVKDNERYCPHCGTDLEAPIAPGGLVDGKTAQEYFDSADIDYELDTNLNKALADCEIALQLDPNFAKAHNLRGLILDEMGRTDDAIASYREAIRLNPGLDEARANLRDAEAEQIKNPPRIPQTIGMMEDSDRQRGGFAKYVAAGVFVILVGLGLFFSFKYINEFATAYLMPKSPIIFVPDLPEGTFVEKQDLELAAQTLTDRCELLGYSYILFEVSEAGEIVGKIPATMDAAEFAEKVGAIGLLEFVDFGETSIEPGTTIRTDFENKYQPQVEGQEWHTVMSNDGIMTAIVSKDPNYETYLIEFALTEKGTKIFFEHTSQNIGTYLGIVLDKSVIASPIINSAIPSGQGSISGNFTQEEAVELAAALQTKPLPFPVRLK